MVKMMREPAFRQDMARAKKLAMAPISITTPIQPMPRFWLRVVRGAVSWSRVGLLLASAWVST